LNRLFAKNLTGGNSNDCCFCDCCRPNGVVAGCCPTAIPFQLPVTIINLSGNCQCLETSDTYFLFYDPLSAEGTDTWSSTFNVQCGEITLELICNSFNNSFTLSGACNDSALNAGTPFQLICDPFCVEFTASFNGCCEGDVRIRIGNCPFESCCLNAIPDELPLEIKSLSGDCSCLETINTFSLVYDTESPENADIWTGIFDFPCGELGLTLVCNKVNQTFSLQASCNDVDLIIDNQNFNLICDPFCIKFESEVTGCCEGVIEFSIGSCGVNTDCCPNPIPLELPITIRSTTGDCECLETMGDNFFVYDSNSASGNAVWIANFGTACGEDISLTLTCNNTTDSFSLVGACGDNELNINEDTIQFICDPFCITFTATVTGCCTGSIEIEIGDCPNNNEIQTSCCETPLPRDLDVTIVSLGASCNCLNGTYTISYVDEVSPGVFVWEGTISGVCGNSLFIQLSCADGVITVVPTCGGLGLPLIPDTFSFSCSPLCYQITGAGNGICCFGSNFILYIGSGGGCDTESCSRLNTFCDITLGTLGTFIINPTVFSQGADFDPDVCYWRGTGITPCSTQIRVRFNRDGTLQYSESGGDFVDASPIGEFNCGTQSREFTINLSCGVFTLEFSTG
jgi:hypothetical protein